MTVGNARESVSEIGLGAEAVELRRLNDRVDRRGMMPAGIGANNEIVLSPQRDARVAFSAMLLSASRRPSARNRLSASRVVRA
jgi:hypothetical protein